MKRMFRFSIAVVIVLLTVIIACKRNNPELIGPAYIDAPEDLSATFTTAAPIPPAGVSFALNQKVNFNGVFTASAGPAKVTWILTIVGPTSGAEYQVSGTGTSFTNVQWGGSHTGLYFFRTGETAKATLSFMGSSLTKTIDVLILKQANFNSCGTYLLSGDFENPSQVYPSSGNWSSFNLPVGTIKNVEQGVYSPTDTSKIVEKYKYDRLDNLIPPVQGKNYFFIRGLGDGPSFVSGVSYHSVPISNRVTSSDPNNVWFNVYVYGTGDLNAGLDIEIHESDKAQSGYVAAVDDSWIYHLELKHTGWKLISFRYSDLTISTNPDLGGRGNRIMEPNKFREVAFVLLKKLNPNAPVEVFFDYPIFSYGAPFKPCK